MAEIYSAPSNPRAGIYTAPGGATINYAPVESDTIQMPDTRGEFSKGWSRGWNQLGATSAGLVGLAGDATNSPSVADWGYETAVGYQEQAAKSAPAVPEFSEISGGGDLFKWFMGTLGEMAPMVVTSVGAGGVGAKLFQRIGAEIAADAIAQKAMEKAAAGLIENGVRAEVAKQVALRYAIKARLGNFVGNMAVNVPLEAGGNWLRDVEEHGINDTNPGRDLGFGLGSAALMSGFSPQAQLSKLTSSAIRAEGKQAAAEYATGMGRAAATGALQGTLHGAGTMGAVSMLGNVAQQRGDEGFFDQNWKGVGNAMAAGAAGGAALGPFTGMWQNSTRLKAPKPVDPVAETKAAGDTKLNLIKISAEEDAAKYDADISQLSEQRIKTFEQIGKLNAELKLVESSPLNPQEAQTRVEHIKSQLDQHNTNIFDIIAQETKLKSEREAFLEQSKKTVEKTQAKNDEAVIKVQAEQKPITDVPPFSLGQDAANIELATRQAEKHANAEVEKAKARINQHQAAAEALSRVADEGRINGQVLDPIIQKMADAHRKHIADEHKYIKTITEAFTKATKSLSETKPGENKVNTDLYKLVTTKRGENHGNDVISAMYTDLMQKSGKEVADKIKAMEKEAFATAKAAQIRNNPNQLHERLYEMRRKNQELQDSATKFAQVEDALTKAGTVADRGVQETMGWAERLRKQNQEKQLAKAAAEQRRIEAISTLYKAQQERRAELDARVGRERTPGINEDIAAGREPGAQPFDTAADLGRVNPTVLGEARGREHPAWRDEVQGKRSVDPRLTAAEQLKSDVQARLEAQRQAKLANERSRAITDDFRRGTEPGLQPFETARDLNRGLDTHVVPKEARGMSLEEWRDARQWKNRASAVDKSMDPGFKAAEVAKKAAIDSRKAWFEPHLEKLVALKDRVKVIHSEDLSSLPKKLRDGYKGGAALIDLESRQIYFLADKLHNKKQAIEAFVHESVAHFGLRTILTARQMQDFLNIVAESMGGTKKWKDLLSKYPEYDKIQVAEEYVAKLAHTVNLNKPETYSTGQRILQSLKTFFTNILKSFGIEKVTDNQIKDLLKAAAFNLTNADATVRAGHAKFVREGIWRTVYESRDYKSKFGELVEGAKKHFSLALYEMDGRGRLQSMVESRLHKFIRDNVNAQEAFKTLVDQMRRMGVDVSSNADLYEIQKMIPNVIANRTEVMLETIVGVNGSGKSGPDTILGNYNKLVGLKLKNGTALTVENMRKEVEQYVLALHAPRANEVSAARVLNEKLIGKLEDKVRATEKAIEEAKRPGSDKKPSAILKMEESVATLKDRIQAEYDKVPKDLSGMSDAKAEEIIANWETPENLGVLGDLRNSYQRLRDFIITEAVENKLISPEQAKRMQELYPDYVPLKHWEQLFPDFAVWRKKDGGKTASMASYEFTKARTGSEKQADFILENLVNKASDVVEASVRRRIGLGVMRLAEEHPTLTSELIEISKKREIAELRTEIKELNKTIDELLPKKEIGTLNETLKAMRDKNRQLNEQRIGLEMDLKDVQLRQEQFNTTEEAKRVEKKYDEVWTKLQTVNDQIFNSKKAIEVLVQKKADVKLSDEARAAVDKRAGLQKQVKDAIHQRGFKYVYDPILDRQVKVLKSEFEGREGAPFTVIDEQGRKVVMLIKDPHLVKALSGVDIVQVPKLMTTLRPVIRFMAQMATTYNPMFILTNPIKDVEAALIHIRNVAEDIPDLNISRHDLMTGFAKNWFKAWPEMRRNEFHGEARSPEWKEALDAYKKYGGHTTMIKIGDLQETALNFDKIIKRNASKDKITDGFFGLLNMTEAMSNTMENTTRLAAFKTISDRMLAHGVPKERAYQVASSIALDLTVNFTQRGNYTGIISSMYMFANAGIQSSRRFLAAMFPESDRGKPIYQKRITKYAMGIAAASFANAEMNRAMMGNDENGINYLDKQSEYTRYSSALFGIPGTKGKFVKLPLTFNYIIMWALGQTASDLWHNNITPGQAVGRVFSSVADSANYLGNSKEGALALVPSAIKPIVQASLNVNYFGGKVSPEKYAGEKGDVPDSQRRWNNTWRGYEKTAEFINAMSGGSAAKPGLIDVSPASMQYVATQYLGGYGQIINGMAHLADKAVTGKGNDFSVNDIPGISRFVTTDTPTNTLSKYAELKKSAEIANETYKRAVAEKVGGAELSRIMRANQAGIRASKMFSAGDSKLAVYNKIEHGIRADSTLTEEQRWTKIHEIEKKKRHILDNMVKQAVAVGVKPYMDGK